VIVIWLEQVFCGEGDSDDAVGLGCALLSLDSDCVVSMHVTLRAANIVRGNCCAKGQRNHLMGATSLST
jgi:hypothetical protein